MLIHWFPFFTSIFQQIMRLLQGYDHPLFSPTQSLISRVSTTLFWWNMATQTIVKVTESYLYWYWWFFNFTSAPHQKPASLMNYFWLACSWDSSGFQLWVHIRISWGAFKKLPILWLYLTNNTCTIMWHFIISMSLIHNFTMIQADGSSKNKKEAKRQKDSHPESTAIRTEKWLEGNTFTFWS